MITPPFSNVVAGNDLRIVLNDLVDATNQSAAVLSRWSYAAIVKFDAEEADTIVVHVPLFGLVGAINRIIH